MSNQLDSVKELIEEAKKKRKKRKQKYEFAFAPFFGAVGARSAATYPKYRPLIYDKSMAGEYKDATVSEPGLPLNSPVTGAFGLGFDVGGLGIGESMTCSICEGTNKFQNADCPACNSEKMVERYEIYGDGVIVGKKIDLKTFGEKTKKLKPNTVINNGKNGKRFEIFSDSNSLFHLFELDFGKRDPRHGLVPAQSEITQVGVFKSLDGAKDFVNSVVH